MRALLLIPAMALGPAGLARAAGAGERCSAGVPELRRFCTELLGPIAGDDPGLFLPSLPCPCMNDIALCMLVCWWPLWLMLMLREGICAGCALDSGGDSTTLGGRGVAEPPIMAAASSGDDCADEL